MSTSGMAVMMTAYRRPGYLRRALCSWAAVRGVSELRSFTIALEPSDRDGQMLAVIEDAKERYGLEIEVRRNPERLGVLVNPVESATSVLENDPEIEFLVFAEEDIAVSDDILEYMDWARGTFGERGDVLLACAHSPDGCNWNGNQWTEHSEDCLHEGGTGRGCLRGDGAGRADYVMLRPDFSPWVWGTWRDRWFNVVEPTWDRDYSTGDEECAGAGWDFNLHRRIIPRGGYSALIPETSRSQNLGRFEGVHASPSDYASTVSPTFREVYGTVKYRVSGEG